MTVFVFAAMFADLITSYDPPTTNASLSLAHPSAAHCLGADSMGRDIYSRIVFGARISLAVGLGSTTLGAPLGIALGLASGYLGGWVDLVFQRVIDVLQALPLLVLALVMAAALGPSLHNTIIAIAIPLMPYWRASSAPTRWRCASSPLSRPRSAIGMSEFRIALAMCCPIRWRR